METDQIAGMLRSVVPVLTTMFVSWGLDNTTAGLVAGAVVAVGAAAWSWVSNRLANKAKDVAASGATVVVPSNASPELKKLAADTSHPNIVPAT